MFVICVRVLMDLGGARLVFGSLFVVLRFCLQTVLMSA